MKNQVTQKWYENPSAVIIFLIFFFPIGLYLMWKNSFWTKNTRIVISVFFGIVILIEMNKDNKSRNLSSVHSIEKTQKCLVDYDWVYPSIKNPSGAWKFSNDGTFNSSTTKFGGMSAWGNWRVISQGRIKIFYTKTSEGIIPNNQVIMLSNCDALIVGSTTYIKY